jgi:single stranded DNA-binding protein
MNVNKCIIVGKVGNIQEPKQTKAGHQMVKFSVAVSKKVKEAWETTWFSCMLFNKGAETFAKWYKKGDLIYCEGQVSASAYIAKDGTAKSDLSLMVNEFHKLSSAIAKEAAPAEVVTPFLNDDTHDDIPF